ncbi:MAG: hypothetical protein M1831_006488 [Alyxoria varia]|nr:MAG: hypothetical protein M1831_006488 [Alyxoria varia]
MSWSSSSKAGRISEPTIQRDRKGNSSSDVAVAMGFGLGPDSVTAAIRHASGEIETIVNNHISDDYKFMMRRLSRASSAHPAPPYSSADEMWRDAPRRLKRKALKTVGFPASWDVGMIAEMLHKIMVHSKLQHEVLSSSVVISYPSLIGLYEEDILDAAIYLGFRASLRRGYHLGQPHELVAAYAGYGMGLCEHYQESLLCEEEANRLPVRAVLSVQCADNAVLLHHRVLSEAYDLERGSLSDPTASADFGEDDGGSRGGDPYNPSRLGDKITELLKSRYNFQNPPEEMTVVITGNEDRSTGSEGPAEGDVQKDFGSEGSTQKVPSDEAGGSSKKESEDGRIETVAIVAQETIKRLGIEPRVWIEDPLFIAARGAAELALRAKFAHTDPHAAVCDVDK